MKLFNIFYKWATGSLSDFTKQFGDNETLYKQAMSFWNSMEGVALFFFITMAIIAIGMAIYYYTAYNNQPGRHYKPKHWIIMGATVCLVTLAVTLGLEYVLTKPKVNGWFVVGLKAAFANMLYALGLYFIVSWIWCQFNLPTNACRIFKF